MRARDLGLSIGLLDPGPLNAITDVDGVRVGHTTIIAGEPGPLLVGRGPVRTGVTVVVPVDGDPFAEGVFAGAHRLNGNGELTGLEWIREAGVLVGPIGITNTHSVGIVRDAIVAAATRAARSAESAWSLPVVGETWDGWLSDIDGQHVRAEHLDAALEAAVGGPVAEGNVGGGTGMICHRFKGGIGSASRRLGARDGGFTVGALVQANYGRRERLAIDGVPVGREIGFDEVPSDREELASHPADADAGSIIVVLATDAPLLPHQCERLAQRAGLGVARTGGAGEHSSGDLFIAFATGNRGLATEDRSAGRPFSRELRALEDAWISPLFWAAIEATEEAIVNALVAAETMAGANGHVAHRLPHDRLVEVWRRHRR
ncbi:MAG: P1 family peptidase [Candidatus Limnocylindrales bacterium]